MTVISPISYYAHYFVPGTPVNVYKQEKVFPPDPIAVKPVKEVIDEFRSALRTQKGAWYLGSKLDLLV
jgi:hypothetical protein